MKTYNVGVIGTGFYSANHLQAWETIPNVRIAALCNRSEVKLREKARQFAVAPEHLYTDYEQMMEREPLDFVDIVTGPESHLAIVRAAARRGLHVLCQKPFAPSREEAEDIVRTAADSGIRLMVTENWRWFQPYRRIRRLLDEGTLGRIYAVRYRHKAYMTPALTAEAGGPQPYFRRMPRLLFFEMGTHWFDTYRFLFGTPKRLYAEMNRISPHIAGEDTGIVVLGHDDFYGFMDMSWATAEELEAPFSAADAAGFVEQLTVDAENGTLKLHSTGKTRTGKLTLTDRSGAEQLIEPAALFDSPGSHIRLQSHFIECLETGRPFETDGRDYLVTANMVFGAYESVRDRRPFML